MKIFNKSNSSLSFLLNGMSIMLKPGELSKDIKILEHNILNQLTGLKSHISLIPSEAREHVLAQLNKFEIKVMTVANDSIERLKLELESAEKKLKTEQETLTSSIDRLNSAKVKFDAKTDEEKQASAPKMEEIQKAVDTAQTAVNESSAVVETLKSQLGAS